MVIWIKTPWAAVQLFFLLLHNKNLLERPTSQICWPFQQIKHRNSELEGVLQWYIKTQVSYYLNQSTLNHFPSLNWGQAFWPFEHFLPEFRYLVAIFPLIHCLYYLEKGCSERSTDLAYWSFWQRWVAAQGALFQIITCLNFDNSLLNNL